MLRGLYDTEDVFFRNVGRNVIQKVLDNPLKTQSRPLYLRTQFVPRCKHFSSRL